MYFSSERGVFSALSDTILMSAKTLDTAIRCLYALGERDFYNIPADDIIGLTLADITHANALSCLGLRLDKSASPLLHTPQFERICPLIAYSFAVRLPTLREVKKGKDFMTDKQIREVFELACQGGAENFDGVIKESFDENRKAVRRKREIPDYCADWLFDYISSHIPELESNANRVLFFRGAVEMLLPKFYERLSDKLEKTVLEFSV